MKRHLIIFLCALFPTLVHAGDAMPAVKNDAAMDFVENHVFLRDSTVQEIGRTPTDVRRRKVMTDVVERLRLAHENKDIDFIAKFLGENKLVIPDSARVLAVPSQDTFGTPHANRDAQTYVKNLTRVFRSTQSVTALADEVVIQRHPVKSDIYGISFHLEWSTERYRDGGVLFLLWDFRDDDRPMVHISYWQPDEPDGKRVPMENRMGLENFEL